jgi:hypothetical protein
MNLDPGQRAFREEIVAARLRFLSAVIHHDKGNSKRRFPEAYGIHGVSKGVKDDCKPPALTVSGVAACRA